MHQSVLDAAALQPEQVSFPCNGRSAGFCTTHKRIDSGPGIASHSLSHSVVGVIISLRMRARVAGSFIRSISFASLRRAPRAGQTPRSC